MYKKRISELRLTRFLYLQEEGYGGCLIRFGQDISLNDVRSDFEDFGISMVPYEGSTFLIIFDHNNNYDLSKSFLF